MSPRLNLATRLATLHASLSAVGGIQTPLWPLFLAWRGLTPVQIGVMLSAAYIVKIVSNPIAGHIADRLGERRLPLMVLSVVAMAAYMPFLFVGGFWPLLILTLIAAGAFTALTPLGDSLTLLAISSHRLHYGHVRVSGSLAFMVFSGLSSYLLIGQPPILIAYTLLAGIAFAVFACYRLPRIKGDRSAGPPRAIGILLRNPVFLLFLAVATLNQSSNTALYGFATLHWNANGVSSGAIGGLWAEMVAAEAVFFIFGHRIAAAIGPRWLLIISAIGGMMRWTICGLTTDPIALAAVQWMHCLTFTATHLGAMYFIQKSIPIEMSGRAQAIYSSVASGLNFGLFLPIAGLFYEHLGGGDTFLLMTGVSACGLGLGIVLLKTWKGQPIFAPNVAATPNPDPV
ncbi:MAG TPA: MFS transporter [Magnetospirillaceae bacterium]|jgi:PPP family 3-phenylpropionic acid transporter